MRTAGPQPRVAGGHCRTSTATSRSQWALPGLNRELQIPVGTAGPQRPDRMPEDMPDGMSDRMPEDMSDRMPEDMPDRMPKDMSDRMPEDMSDRMPEDLPDRMPEDMPEHMPEDMPDRMPEDLPVRKCINVMVRITRSKVIQLSGIREAICCRYNKFFTQWKVWVSWHYPTSPDVGELL